MKGKEVSIDKKLCVIELKKAFALERSESELISTKDSTGRIARGLNLGRRTVEMIISEYNQKGETFIDSSEKSRGKPTYKLDSSSDLVSVIRHHIREQNKKGEHVSVRNVRAWLLQDFKFDLPITTLWRSLQRIGFEYGDSKRRSALREKDYVITARREYLRVKIANRKKNGKVKRSEVYLDETYLNKNHSNESTWYSEEDGPLVNKPSGKGPRLIIVNAITADGWVKGAELVFKADSVSGD